VQIFKNFFQAEPEHLSDHRHHIKNRLSNGKYRQPYFVMFVQGILKGDIYYYCTVEILFDWFGLVCFANKNKNWQLFP
jgi:hypothetical protein